MKLVVVCFLVTLACVSAQQNGDASGIARRTYDLFADPTRSVFISSGRIPFVSDIIEASLDLGARTADTFDRFNFLNRKFNILN